MKKLEKIIFFTLITIASKIKMKWSTNLYYLFLKKRGVKFNGKPNYISSKIWFDGTNYSLIEIGDQVTMSSYIRVLTHDWALHTIAKAFNISQDKPLGRIKGVKIGDFSFIGTGTILMPGCEIGKGCIIAAGTVVRGKVENFSIYAGSPGKVIGNSKEYLDKVLNNK